jgi:hypothetical protein
VDVVDVDAVAVVGVVGVVGVVVAEAPVALGAVVVGGDDVDGSPLPPHAATTSATAKTSVPRVRRALTVLLGPWP